MSLNSVNDLINVVEIVAKRMLRSISIPVKYIYLYLLAFIPVISSIFLTLNDPIICFISLTTGLIGFTTLSVYIISLIYMVNKHLELAKIYYSDLRDIITRIKHREELGDFEEEIEDLLLCKKINIEYTPIILVPGYMLLLIEDNWLYVVILFIIYSVLSSFLTYWTIQLFNNHVSKEKKIEYSLTKILNINISREYGFMKFDKKELLISILSFASILIVFIYRSYDVLDMHISTHRANYEGFKNALLKLVGQYHDYIG
ncbi:MAG: hypothetical protein B6U89_04950 [Desulfurococcales archaeon ex4484_58]|nr:MAG: hypothetical protein B6U89_04950 [Desulfurococcales archaeon ex4484_58]